MVFWGLVAAAHEDRGFGVASAAELSSEDGCVTELSSVTKGKSPTPDGPCFPLFPALSPVPWFATAVHDCEH